MPTLSWRTDSDGFAFLNTWALDDTERSVLSGLAPGVVASTVAAVIGPLVLDPITLTALTATLTVAAQGYLQFGHLDGYGLCGGMSYLGLDYWSARAALPRGAHEFDQPNRTGGAVPSQLRNLIWARLLDSLQSGGVLQRTLEWSLLLNQIPKELGGGAQRLLANTKNEWIVLEARIDSGQPCPIGLVYFKRNVWDQHQILAYGYEDHGNGTATMQVYDCNKTHQFGETYHRLVELDSVVKRWWLQHLPTGQTRNWRVFSVATISSFPLRRISRLRTDSLSVSATILNHSCRLTVRFFLLLTKANFKRLGLHRLWFERQEN